MNLVKTSLLIISIIMISACSSKSSLMKPTEFNTSISTSENHTILDVRTPGEFSSGYIKNAINIDIYSDHFDEKINALDKSKPVFVYCKSGGRSSDASKRLAAAGFKQINELDGGLLQWQNADLPLTGITKPPVTQYTLDQYMSEVASDGIVLVDFYATWCGPCKKMAPHIKKLHEQFPDIKVVKVDTEKSQAVARHFSISGIPLVKLYVKGEEVYDRTGYHTLAELTKLVKKHS